MLRLEKEAKAGLKTMCLSSISLNTDKKRVTSFHVFSTLNILINKKDHRSQERRNTL